MKNAERILDRIVWWGIAWVAGALLAGLCLSGCVTKVSVCVETAHGYGRGAELGYQRNTVGGSVCADVERPQ